ncbi:MAG: divergent PAP2 family protein [Bacilli bacterium]|nr:divergent PAP2 family protein [Bacilli bacterium]MDD4282604.1 divergent PAP2 family protein [Bacilli bacterium]MDD4718526.1 divergent PAP2 family protein [Bacilli bacterium]
MEEYKYLIVPLTTLLIAQLIKFIFESINDNELKWGRLFNGSGGMPSSHGSFSFSLTMMIGLNEGFSSVLFAIALIFSLIVAYDAIGIRLESEKHAQALNQISKQIFSKNYKEGFAHLKEELGHTILEIVGAYILATTSALIFTYVIF